MMEWFNILRARLRALFLRESVLRDIEEELRVHEIGVRVALGAKPRDVLLLTISQAMSVATIGLAIGLLGALGLTHFLTRFLYGVKPTDLATFVIACALLTATALLACYLPARRAARVDPVVALKHE